MAAPVRCRALVSATSKLDSASPMRLSSPFSARKMRNASAVVAKPLGTCRNAVRGERAAVRGELADNAASKKAQRATHLHALGRELPHHLAQARVLAACRRTRGALASRGRTAIAGPRRLTYDGHVAHSECVEEPHEAALLRGRHRCWERRALIVGAWCQADEASS
jgi:hypothetical protein